MKFQSDAFFSIGKTHMVCQDYARAGVTKKNTAYAIVCDGCSSSPDTDVGARTLALAAQPELAWISTEDSLEDREMIIIASAYLSVKHLADPRALDSTLLVAYENRNPNLEGHVRVDMRGDGVVAARRRDGSFVFFVVEHAEGAPHYLNYRMDPERHDSYRAQFGTKFTIHEYDSRGGWRAIVEESEKPHPDTWAFWGTEFDLVVVMSDGVQTFQRLEGTTTSKTRESIPVEDVVDQILSIKGTAGKFLQRRCHKFLTKFCDAQQWQHNDDFSAAAIWIGEDPA